MSLLPASTLTSYDPGLTSSKLPAIDQSRMPAEIRSGDAQAKKAYQEALGFEEILVQQLTQELAKTVTSPSSDGGAGGSGGSSSSGGMLGSDPSTSAFAGMIPTALTSSIMSGGGVGIADRIAHAIDPAIGTPQGSAASVSGSTGKAQS